ncbi:hypothetical protein CP532_5799 [Ophiocordyceps camponoti-leonardi (nom. inval.)]|nr:hypothetical protein CP532_5799 [Ophiocordyceps camponoti-leonardi (nom. inval.)]
MAANYDVEDRDPEANISTDPWGRFLFARYRRRKSLFTELNDKEKDVVSKELRRVEYLRDAVKDRKLSEEDTSPLISLLHQARTSWNKHAYERCHKELSGRESANISARDRRIMKAVIERQGIVGNEDESYLSSSNESLDTSNQSTQDSSRGETAYQTESTSNQPHFGYNGWHISFQSGTGGVNNPDCYGEFPHQKIEIQKLLSDKENSPLRKVREKGRLQYFHLPANNMAWVEAAIKRYYDEEEVDLDNHRPSRGDGPSKTKRILTHDLWRGRQRGDQGLPAHARQIGARCSLVPVEEGGKGNDISLFLEQQMPYLHWEIENRLRRMSRIVQQTTKDQRMHHKDQDDNWYHGKFADLVLNWRIKLSKNSNHDSPTSSKPFRPDTKLARLLWYSAKLFEIIDEATEERMIREHLWTRAPIHIRRTLDQFFHWTIDRTEAQDQTQVVCRGTRSRKEARGIGRVVMVDQLWMWILDENTILTSFPRRWGRNKPDPSAVHRAIRHHIGTLDGSKETTIYDLALIIIDECSKIFFDRTKPLDLRPEVVTIFGSAISELAEMKTMIYERFGRDVNTIDLNGITDSSEAEKLLRKSLNVHLEWSVLVEAQHIIDELQIMQQVFNHQLCVVRDFQSAISETGSPVRERAAALIADIEMRRDELVELERLPSKTREQQQAGIFEAKAAIQRADEAALQGRSIMVFTVFTIIFLPLSFFATVFGMNNVEMTKGPMPLADQLKYMIAVSGAVILVSLAFAFSALTRTAIAVGFKVLVRHVVHRLGIYDVVTKTRPTHHLKQLDKNHKKKQEENNTKKRLAEIKLNADKKGFGNGFSRPVKRGTMRGTANGNNAHVEEV